jgi:hypothetical protein
VPIERKTDAIRMASFGICFTTWIFGVFILIQDWLKLLFIVCMTDSEMTFFAASGGMTLNHFSASALGASRLQRVPVPVSCRYQSSLFALFVVLRRFETCKDQP